MGDVSNPKHSDSRTATGSTALLIGALALGWVMVYANRSLLPPLLPVIGDELHLSGTQRGAIASTYFALYVAMQVPAGVLGDWLGLKRVLVTMYLAAGIGMLAIGLLAWNYALLLVFMGLHGLGAGAFYSGAYGLTVTSVPADRRGASASLVSVGMAVGLALGLVLSPFLLEALDSWRLPYAVMAVPTLVLALFFVRAVRQSPTVPREGGGYGIRFFLSHRDLLPLCVAAFCLFYAHWVLLTWAPSFLFEERGVSLRQAGPFAAVVSLPTLVGTFLWARVSDRLGRKRVLVAVMPVAVLAILGLAFFTSTAMALVSLALYGLCGALALNPLVVSWAGDHILASRRVGIGTGIAIFNTFAVASSIVGPLLTGRVRDATGSLEGAFYVAAGVIAVGMLLALLPREAVRGVVVGRRGVPKS